MCNAIRHQIRPIAAAASAISLLVVCAALALVVVILRYPRRYESASLFVLPLVGVYKHNYHWWFSITFLRRFLLVLTISFIPHWSLYISIAFFAIIQVSASLQQWFQPFDDRLDNYSELTSLFILLVNFFSCTVFGFAGQANDSISAWFWWLLVVNALFVILLVLRAFVSVFILTGKRRPIAIEALPSVLKVGDAGR